MKESTPQYVKNLAREMRKEPTPAEERLWDSLRRNNLKGYKFYRQYPIGRCIADFCCPQKKLIIELDGPIHDVNSRRVYDELRDKLLHYEGMKVIRFKNEQVLDCIDDVLNQIVESISSSIPLPQDGGGAGERVDWREARKWLI